MGGSHIGPHALRCHQLLRVLLPDAQDAPKAPSSYTSDELKLMRNLPVTASSDYNPSCYTRRDLTTRAHLHARGLNKFTLLVLSPVVIDGSSGRP